MTTFGCQESKIQGPEPIACLPTWTLLSRSSAGITQGPPSLFANRTWNAGPNGCLSLTVNVLSSTTSTLATCASQLPTFGASAATTSTGCLASATVAARP